VKKLLMVTLTLVITCALVLGSCTTEKTVTQTAIQTATEVETATETAVSTETETATETEFREKIILKLSVAIPPGDPHVERLHPWIENFNAAADGRYEMQLFEGGQLAGTMDTLDAVRLQVVEIGHGAMQQYGGYNPVFEAAQVPYMLNNYEANYEFTQLMFDYDNEILMNDFNQILLSSWCMGFNELYTVDTPVRTMEDLQGLTFSATSTIMGQTAEALGASAVIMDWPDEMPSLEKGIVDAGMATVAGAMAFMSYWDLIDYYVESSFMGGHLCVTMNLDVFNAMPADLQQVMLDEGRAYQEDMNEIMAEFSFDWALGELEANGVDIYVLPPEERARWKAACEPIEEAYWELLGEEDAQIIKDAAAAANAKFPYGG
jgi:TRAP-type C4-dicarboxylate transport system substrate-binding protein